MSHVVHREENAGPAGRTLKVLAVSDRVEPQLYNEHGASWLPPLDLIISCGDLPPYYLDYLMTTLNAPLMHVLGNHCEAPHDIAKRCSPEGYPGAQNLHERVARFTPPGSTHPLLLAGMGGSPLYNGGPHQLTEPQAFWSLLHLVPGLLTNKVTQGRYLDLMITHAPPRGIHDREDVTHRGFTSLLPFIRRYKPLLMLHGHTHRYEPLLPTRSTYMGTEIINVFGHVLLELEPLDSGRGWRLTQPTRTEATGLA